MTLASLFTKERTIRLDDIIDAAERVYFGSNGQTVTMDDVAREADFSKRTIYKYFSNRDLLMLAIALRGHRLLNWILLEVAEKYAARSGLDRLAAYGRIYLEFRNRYPEYFSLILGCEAAVSSMAGMEGMARQCYEEGEKPHRPDRSGDQGRFGERQPAERHRSRRGFGDPLGGHRGAHPCSGSQDRLSGRLAKYHNQ